MKLIIGELNPGAGKDGDGCESDSGTIWKHRNLRVRTRHHIAGTFSARTLGMPFLWLF